MFSRMILICCAGLIAISPAFAASSELNSSVTSEPTYKSNSAPATFTAPETTRHTPSEASKIERLTKLLESCWTRSPDFQFIVQKIMGRSASASEVRRTIAKVTQASSGVWALTDRSDPDYPKELIPLSDSNDPRSSSREYSSLRRISNSKISQTEWIMMFGKIQDLEEKLASDYKDYLHGRDLVQATTNENHTEQALQLRTKLLEKRKKLVALAGEAAVAELDTELDQEAKTKPTP